MIRPSAATRPAIPAFHRAFWHGLLRLTRPGNALPAAALVVVGAKLSGAWPPPPSVWAATAAMLCITAFGYVTNDLADVRTDAINKPDRPLPSGTVPRSIGRALAATLAAAGVLFATFTGLLGTLVAAAVLALLWMYNQRLKSIPAGGNLTVAGLAGCALMTGSVAAHGLSWAAIRPLLPAAITLAAFIACRELRKTVEDVAGDRAMGVATAATTWGIARTMRLYAASALVCVGVTFAAVPFAGYTVPYAALMVAGVHLPLLRPLIGVAATGDAAVVGSWLRWLKASYLAGLIALWIA